MTNVNHYVNLIGWKLILDIMESDDCSGNVRHKYFCDTISIKVLAFFLGKNVKLVPGPSMTGFVYNLNDSIYLTAYKTSLHEIILPFFRSRSEIDSYVKSVDIRSRNIIIGISSPSQNYLAARLAESLKGEADIYCLGAAIYLNKAYEKKPTFFWVKFIFKQPKRTFFKTFQTVREIFSIVLFQKNREMFKIFLNYLE